MIFRRPKSYSITLQRAHSLLKIPREDTTTTVLRVREELTQSISLSHGGPSRDQIQKAFREAAKRHHPDLARGVSSSLGNNATNKSAETPLTKAAVSKEADSTIRECYEARELLLDYYIRKKFVHPEIIQSVLDKPSKKSAETWFSVWGNERSFRIEVLMRLSLCLGLAAGTYYHDLYLPERRKQQMERRDAQYYNVGPQ